MITEAQKKANKKYIRSDKGKEASKRYQQSERGKANSKRHSQTDKGKETRARIKEKYKQSGKYRAAILQRLYKLSPVDYAQLLKQQDWKCAICFREFDKKNLYGIHIDHNHTTGKVRGLLCRKCNTALGLFEDDIYKLIYAIKYLERNKDA